MNEIICHTPHLAEGEELNISFMDLLLNDTLAEGELQFPETLYNEIGDLNTKLTCKRNYEFLLRAAQKYPIKLVGGGAATTNSTDQWEAFRTDCYITGKYQQELQDTDYFNPVIETLLANASTLPNHKEAVNWLEKMISHSPEYYQIDDDTQPILIYKGSDICYNTLNFFANELAQALKKYHQRVEVLDLEKEGNHALTRYINYHFKAIIGIQTYAFSIMMQDKTTNFHDLMIGPKFNLILDHPAWLKDHMENVPKDYYLLIHDRNYIAFANQYYKNIAGCIHFPPGGSLPPTAFSETKLYDITFIGSYRNYRERLNIIRTYDRKHRFFAARYLRIMKEHPDYPAETAFRQTLAYYNWELNDKDYLDLFYEMRQACFCIMLYYREKVLQTLLDAGITIHVYSDSWEKAPFAHHPCLICHPALDIADSLTVMQQSRISLNIMSWHKDGLTERILNAMLCKSVVLSDKSTILEEEFSSGKYSVLFDLKELELLPLQVKKLLANEDIQKEIAINGYQNVNQKHLWEHRAKYLLQILEKI